MSVVFDPGWGSTLAQAFSSIGGGLSDALFPDQDMRRALRAKLLDPKAAQDVGNMASLNPDLYDAAHVGNRNAATISGIRPSQEFLNDQSIAKAFGSAANDPGNMDDILESGHTRSATTKSKDALDIEGKGMENKSRALKLDADTISLKETKDLMKYIDALPDDDKQRRHFVQAFGMNPEDLDKLKRNSQLIKDGEKIPPAEVRSYAEKAEKGDSSAARMIEAYAAASPESYKLMTDAMDFDKKAALEKSLIGLRASADKSKSSKDLALQVAMNNVQNTANQYDLPAGVVAKMYGYDKDYPDAFGTVTAKIKDEDVTAAKAMVNEKAAANHNKVINDALTAVRTNATAMKAKGTRPADMPMLISNLSTALENMSRLTGKDIKVVKDDGFFSGKKVQYLMDGKPISQEDLLNPEFFSTKGLETKIPSDTISKPEVTPEEAAAELKRRRQATGGGK